jgi:hypothetical protein
MSKCTITYNDGDVFDWRFQCFVKELHYDYETKRGYLVIGNLSCTDMVGCISLFKCIDENVKTIETYCGDCDGGNIRDTTYIKSGKNWVAYSPEKQKMGPKCDDKSFPASHIPRKPRS